MDSQWNEEDAGQCNGDDLALRVYTSRLLGADARLVMHGGGNTSVKVHGRDFFGRELDLLYVKGSGWDLATIEKPGFPALRLEETCMLAELERLSDVDMTRELRALMVDPGAPAPSVEAILHAVIPHRFVDHTHADAVVTLTNNPQGDAIIAELYPDCLILPYVMPGFVLAKQVWVALQEEGLQSYKGIILAHHGVFTFADDARTAYENMIELVTRAEAYISERYAPARDRAASAVDLLALARIRRAVSEQRGEAQLAVLDDSSDAVAFAARAANRLSAIGGTTLYALPFSGRPSRCAFPMTAFLLHLTYVPYTPLYPLMRALKRSKYAWKTTGPKMTNQAMII